MTSPQDPFSAGDETPQGGQPGPPAYGQPPQGQPYGQPGYGQPPYGQPYPPTGTNGMAIAALICAFLCSPLGIILGFIARGQIKQTRQGGDGLALAAIIIGFVSIALGVLVFGIAAANAPDTTY